MDPNAKIRPLDTTSPTAVAAARDSSASGDFHGSRFQEEADRTAQYRLVIEEGPQAGTFVYKTLDRVTGEIVRQLPRQEVVDLMRTSHPSAGSVINTTA